MTRRLCTALAALLLVAALASLALPAMAVPRPAPPRLAPSAVSALPSYVRRGGASAGAGSLAGDELR
jgi:hypothetical protein